MSPIKTSKMTNYRWVICAMLFFATTVNYMDRQVLSLTYPGEGGIQQEFGWSDDNYGTITAYFSIIYALCMLFAGKFVDWMGTRKGYLWAIFVWSTGAVLHAFCGIATSGIAGPSGGSEEKPVGTVWMAWATPKGTYAECFHLGKLREQITDRACMKALIGLLKILKNE